MLENIIKSLTPEIIASTIQTNPLLVSQVLLKFDAFVSFGKALTPEQQTYISSNIDKLSEFFRQDDVKQAIGIIAEAFITKTTPNYKELH